MAAPNDNDCIFGVKKAVEQLLKDPEKAKKEIPPQGFIGLGSFDENWGFLRYDVKSATSQYLVAHI